MSINEQMVQDIAKLLIHYYDPQKGSISIGGQKLCDMSLEALNSRISYVAQDQYLFNTSLLENIRLGRLQKCYIRFLTHLI